MPKAFPRIGVVATSSAVPEIELELGVEHLRSLGFDVVVHPSVLTRHFTFAGTDEQRWTSLHEYATDQEIDVVWCARGGYGAARLLPELDRATRERGRPPPRKLLVGYSDITVLHEFVRTRWDWATLHAPMPAASDFATLSPGAWPAIRDCLARRKPTAWPWASGALSWLTDPPARPIDAPLVGGNLTLWCTLAGTPYQPAARGRIVFFEDIGEPYYRLDRMMTQMVQAGMLDGAAAIVLGDFTNCADETPTARAARDTADVRPLRKVYDENEGFREIFGTVGRRLGIPIAEGLPVGHGAHFAPLPLGASYRLSPAGELRLADWGWLNPSA